MRDDLLGRLWGVCNSFPLVQFTADLLGYQFRRFEYCVWLDTRRSLQVTGNNAMTIASTHSDMLGQRLPDEDEQGSVNNYVKFWLRN